MFQNSLVGHVATSHVHLRGDDSRIHHLKVPNGDIWHAVVRDDELRPLMPMDVLFDADPNARARLAAYCDLLPHGEVYRQCRNTKVAADKVEDRLQLGSRCGTPSLHCRVGI